MNKPGYLGLSIQELMYEFWYDYVKAKNGKKAKLCYMDKDSFVIYLKTNDFTETLQKMLELDLIFQIMN